ncbi:MAG: hypothetical protein ABIH86_06090 [Planctomycetota bacterium]
MKSTRISPFTVRPHTDIEPIISSQTAVKPRVCVAYVGSFGKDIKRRIHAETNGASFFNSVLVDWDSDNVASHQSMLNLPPSLLLQQDADAASTAVYERRGDVARLLGGYRLVIILASLSDPLSSGVAKTLSSISRDCSRTSVGLAVMPFAFESRIVRKRAAQTLEDWRLEAHCVIASHRDRLGDAVTDNDTLDVAMDSGADWLAGGIRAMAATHSEPLSLTPGAIGFSDFLGQSGVCQSGFGSARGDDALYVAVERAVSQSMLTRADLLNAGPVMVHIASKYAPTLSALNTVADRLQDVSGSDADVRFAFGRDESLGDQVIAAVFARASDRRLQKRRSLEPQRSVASAQAPRNAGGLYGLQNRNIPAEKNYDIPTYLRKKAG